jgi:hypothetical protein
MFNLVIINNENGIRTTNIHLHKLFEYLSTMPNFKTVGYIEIAAMSETQMIDFFIQKFGAIPDNIIFFEHLTEMDQINIPIKCKINVIIDDLHHKGKIKKNRMLGLKKVSRVLSTYGYCFAKYYTTDIPIYFFPHAAVFDIPFNMDPIGKILVSGRLNKYIYPFRNLLYELSKKNKYVEYMPVNCSYEVLCDSEELIYGKRYIEKLNKYLVCFTCDASENRPYIVAKHFEILSSGALLLAGNPNTKKYFEKLGFIDGVHYIAITTENLLDKIGYVMHPNNKETIDKIRKNGYEFVKKKHFYKNRAEYLACILEENRNRITSCSDGICASNYFLENIFA